MTTFTVERADHVSFTVSDIERSIEFWTRFGFTLVNRYQIDEPEMSVSLGVPDAAVDIQLLRRPDGFTIELVRYRGTPADRAPGNGTIGAAHVAFVVDDLLAAHAELRDAGVTFVSEPNVDLYGDRWVYLRDPDGITVELMQPAPRSQRAVSAA